MNYYVFTHYGKYNFSSNSTYLGANLEHILFFGGISDFFRNLPFL